MREDTQKVIIKWEVLYGVSCHIVLWYDIIISDVDKKLEVIYSDTSAKAHFTMTSAVLSGLTQPDTLVAQQTKYNCPSGNCTWDTFQSLAVCSACIDITDRLIRNIVPFVRLTTCFDTPVNLTVFSLPNGLNLTNVLEKEPPIAWMTGFGTGNESQSISFGSKDTLIWSMTMIRVLDPDEVWSNSSVIAVECGLWYCVRNYDSMVKDGNLIEVVSPVTSMRSHNSWQWSFHPSEYGDYDEENKGPDTLSFGETSGDNITDLQLDDRFNVSEAAVYGISNLMNTTFTRSADDEDIAGAEAKMNKWAMKDGNIAACDKSYSFTSSGLLEGINAFFGYGYDNFTIQTSTAMPFLYHSQDLNATFATLAKSMTNNIRENSDDNLVMIDKADTLHVIYQVQ